MDKDYLQVLRHKLQKRIERQQNSDYQNYRINLKLLFQFLNKQIIFSGILDEIEKLSDGDDIIKICDSIIQQNYYGEIPDDISEKRYAAICYGVLKQCSKSDKETPDSEGIITSKPDYFQYLSSRDARKRFNNHFLIPFYEYIDENIDESGVILSLLRKYKERCEWFRRESLYSMWENDTQRGEKLLANDMYEYLHDQGLDFFIEPNSASGQIDMISSQQGENRLLVDAKIFNPDKSKPTSYIIKGFHQIYTYTQDFNQPIGYLIIFKTCEHDLKFSLSEGLSSIPFMTHNNKTIFFITVDIFLYDKSASKRGTLTSYEITEADLTKDV